MKKLFLKFTRLDPVFRFFRKYSLPILFLAGIFAVDWERHFWLGAGLFLLLLIVGGSTVLLTLLRRKPKVSPRSKARWEPQDENYAEIDALLTEMEIPYYESRAAKRCKTAQPVRSFKDKQLAA